MEKKGEINIPVKNIYQTLGKPPDIRSVQNIHCNLLDGGGTFEGFFSKVCSFVTMMAGENRSLAQSALPSDFIGLCRKSLLATND
jgi:hypothetical protein